MLLSLFAYEAADEPDKLISSYAPAIPVLAVEANLASLLCNTVSRYQIAKSVFLRFALLCLP